MVSTFWLDSTLKKGLALQAHCKICVLSGAHIIHYGAAAMRPQATITVAPCYNDDCTCCIQRQEWGRWKCLSKDRPPHETGSKQLSINVVTGCGWWSIRRWGRGRTTSVFTSVDIQSTTVLSLLTSNHVGIFLAFCVSKVILDSLTASATVDSPWLVTNSLLHVRKFVRPSVCPMAQLRRL